MRKTVMALLGSPAKWARCAAWLLLALGFALNAAPSARAQNVWTNQQGARLVIGQSSFTRQNPLSSREVLGSAAGVAVANDTLFVADGNRVGATPINNRVLIYQNLSSFIPPLEAELPQTGPCPVCTGVPDVVLGQPDFENFDPALQDGMQNPTGVASDGQNLVVADTNNNRVLIWRFIPFTNGSLPDVVLGQPDSQTNAPATSQTGMRGPQGVWIDNGKVFVADTQNSRILIWNSIPAQNGAPADIVVGQPDFDTRPEPDLTQTNVEPSATALLDPVSVTVNNGRMFVTDLGYNRVLIYNSIPTQNTAPADVVIGQPDMTSQAESPHSNNSFALCPQLEDGEQDPGSPDGQGVIPRADRDSENPRRFPRRCEKTLSFPRFALSDGERLYIADGGNDRVLIFDEIPQENGAAADVVLGQPDFRQLTESDGAGNVRAPSSLAHDGANLYVADPFTRRILVFTPAENLIEQDGVRNGAAFEIHSVGRVFFDGDPSVGQIVRITIGDITVSEPQYEYTTVEEDTPLVIRDKLLEIINSDEEGPVTARPIPGDGEHALVQITFGGAVRAGEMLRMNIAGRSYTVEAQPGDEPFLMVDRFAFVINNREDPDIFARRKIDDINTLELVARQNGPEANGIPIDLALEPDSQISAEQTASATQGGERAWGLSLVFKQEGPVGNVRLDATVSGAGLTIDSAGARMTGGSDARELPAGTMAAIFGENLADGSYDPDPNAERLPTELGGVRVYCNGIQAPLFSVTPTQVNFQVPWEVEGAGISTYIWRRMPDGNIRVTVPRANDSTRAAPGLFAFDGPEPRRGVVLHGNGKARGTVAVTPPAGTTSTADDEAFSAPAGVTLTIRINERSYTYTTEGGESLETVRDRLVEAINAGEGDPNVTAAAEEQGFFSARADVTFSGEPAEGDTVTLLVNGRPYSYTVQEGDSLEVVRNILVERINTGRGDPDVTARRLIEVGVVKLQVVARSLGVEGNDILFNVSVSSGASIQVTTNVEEQGTLIGGQTPPVVELFAREVGRQGNLIRYSAESSDAAQLVVTARDDNLCCGNIPFSLVTQENPAIPGEIIFVYGTGLGLTSPLPRVEGLESGEKTPESPEFLVPFNAQDFVSSLAGRRTAQLEAAKLAPGMVGIYEIQLRLNEGLPDNPFTELTIAQVLFISNAITFPVKNLEPRAERSDFF